MSKYKLYADIDCLCLRLHLAWELKYLLRGTGHHTGTGLCSMSMQYVLCVFWVLGFIPVLHQVCT